MRRVLLESPYAGDVDLNVKYARRAMLDSLERGEAPLLSHLLYTQVLDDNIIEQRRAGIAAGHSWMEVAHAVVVYVDYGVSSGMAWAIALATSLGIPVEERRIISDAIGD
jgi:hypothetical protein